MKRSSACTLSATFPVSRTWNAHPSKTSITKDIFLEHQRFHIWDEKEETRGPGQTRGQCLTGWGGHQEREQVQVTPKKRFFFSLSCLRQINCNTRKHHQQETPSVASVGTDVAIDKALSLCFLFLKHFYTVVKVTLHWCVCLVALVMSDSAT